MSAEFERLEREWLRIVRERDLPAARDFMADDFVLTSAGGAAPQMRKADWLAALGQIETRAFGISDVEARVFGDAAVVRLTAQWDASVAGRDLTGDYAIVDVFTRPAGRWQPSWRISTRLSES